MAPIASTHPTMVPFAASNTKLSTVTTAIIKASAITLR
jgi:hypothetical protein